MNNHGVIKDATGKTSKQKLIKAGQSWTCPAVWTVKTVEEEVNNLYKDINDCLEKTCPKKSALRVCPRKASRIKSWWDPTAENAREVSMRLREEYLNWIKERQNFFNTFPDIESLLDTTKNQTQRSGDENIDLLNRSQNSDDDAQHSQNEETPNNVNELHDLHHEVTELSSLFENNSKFEPITPITMELPKKITTMEV